MRLRNLVLRSAMLCLLHACSSGGDRQAPAAEPDDTSGLDVLVDPDVPDVPDAREAGSGCPTGTVSITPQTPRTGDSLVASVSASGPVIITWRVAGGAPLGTGATLPASATAKGQTIAVVVSSELDPDCPPLTTEVQIGNSPPSISQVAITPSAAYATQTLTCSVPEAAWKDPDDGDPREPRFEWLRNGAPVAGATEPTLAGAFARGDSVRCRVTPSDGAVDGQPRESLPVPIINSPPEASSVGLGCPEPGEPFVCTAEGADPDEETVRFRFAWHQAPDACGAPEPLQLSEAPADGATGSTLSAVPQKGTALRCCATPVDEEGLTGPAVGSEPCPVPNHPPEVGGAVVSNTLPGAPIGVASTLACGAPVTDPDGDAVTTACEWRVEGELVLDGPCSLSGAFVKGESVCCQISADDGTAEALSSAKSCVLVGDTPPQVVSVALDPQSPSHCALPQCHATAADPDGDLVDVLYGWKVDGQPTASPAPGPGQTLACTATPVAGGVVGAMAEESVIIDNAAPTLAGVAVTADPMPARTDSTLSCQPAGWSDEDGCDAPTHEFAWYVGGQPIEGATGDTLAGDAFVAGDAVVCVVTPGDGTEQGTPVQSAVVEIQDSPPVADTVFVTPIVGNHLTVFTCSATATDADGEGVEWSYSWAVDGVPIPGTGPTRTGVPFSGNGALLTCAATPLPLGEPVASQNQAVLVDTPPAVSSVILSPAAPDTAAALTCTASATDADGDPVTLSYEWLRETHDGLVPLSGSAATFPASGTAHFDTLRCRVTPNDGRVDGAPLLSNAVTVRNTPPVLAGVGLQPSGGTATTDFTCVPGASTDLDGDDVTVAIVWRLNGQVVAGATGAVAVPSELGGDVGDTLECVATPSDGFDDGATVASSPAVLAACAQSDGEPCDDGNACTAGDACQAGACVGDPIPCQDGDPCTADGCHPAEGCVFSGVTTGCDDGDPCTEDDSCASGQCKGAPVSCDDGNDCTVGVCSQGAGCQQFASVGGCDDGSVCTEGDYCSGGTCQPGPAVACDDGDPCTTDGCLPGSGCTSSPSAAPCEDGDPCTVGDTCGASGCVAGAPATCTDDNPCTADGCTPGVGCSHSAVPNGAACSDDDPCTDGDECAGGVCTPGPALPCDDGNVCTSDECVSGVGCTFATHDGPCGEGGVCNGGTCCVPDCDGKNCGDDGCGGICGACSPFEECLPEGVCTEGEDDEMVLVPSGSFWMGCDPAEHTGCELDEQPVHEVSLPAYEIDITEVTVDEYAVCVDAQVCPAPSTLTFGCTWDNPDAGDFPVNCVDWHAANTFCAFAGKRLCTEAEWEKAARGTDRRTWPWGEEEASCIYAVMKDGPFLGCNTGLPWPVGLIADGASPYGALDMAGNVSEWVNDWHLTTYYSKGPLEDPQGPGFGVSKIHRGGHYWAEPPTVRTFNRITLAPNNATESVGFRCCRDFP